MWKTLGRVVSGYKVQRINRKDEWTLIGKQDPQLPQMFYPVANNLTLTKGDTVVSISFDLMQSSSLYYVDFVCYVLNTD